MAAGYESQAAERFQLRQLSAYGLEQARRRVVACVAGGPAGAERGGAGAGVEVARLPVGEDACVQALAGLLREA